MRKFVPLPKIVKNLFRLMKNLGNTLRELREGKRLSLRTVAAYLDIDQAILSRIDEDIALEALKVAEEQVKYLNIKR